MQPPRGIALRRRLAGGHDNVPVASQHLLPGRWICRQGPATAPQPCFAVRTAGGAIQVMLLVAGSPKGGSPIVEADHLPRQQGPTWCPFRHPATQANSVQARASVWRRPSSHSVGRTAAAAAGSRDRRGARQSPRARRLISPLRRAGQHLPPRPDWRRWLQNAPSRAVARRLRTGGRRHDRPVGPQHHLKVPGALSPFPACSKVPRRRSKHDPVIPGSPGR